MLSILLLYDPTISVLGIYTREIKAFRHRYLYDNVPEALFTVAKIESNPIYKFINKLQYIHKMEYSSEIKWN